MASPTERMIVSLKLGPTRGANLRGEPTPVLLALALLIVCVWGVMYIATSSPGCSAQHAVKFGQSFFAEGAR
jgi:hypothetical protein